MLDTDSSILFWRGSLRCLGSSARLLFEAHLCTRSSKEEGRRSYRVHLSMESFSILRALSQTLSATTPPFRRHNSRAYRSTSDPLFMFTYFIILYDCPGYIAINREEPFSCHLVTSSFSLHIPPFEGGRILISRGKLR